MGADAGVSVHAPDPFVIRETMGAVLKEQKQMSPLWTAYAGHEMAHGNVKVDCCNLLKCAASDEEHCLKRWSRKLEAGLTDEPSSRIIWRNMFSASVFSQAFRCRRDFALRMPIQYSYTTMHGQCGCHRPREILHT